MKKVDWWTKLIDEKSYLANKVDWQISHLTNKVDQGKKSIDEQSRLIDNFLCQ